jgi:signal peptidase I
MASNSSSKGKSRPKSSGSVAQARARGARGGGKRGGSASGVGKWLWDNGRSLLGAIIIYLFIRTLLVEAYRIPSGSMIPTLKVGDWLFVNKLAYGPTIPFTNSHLPGYAHPRRGDVVVFESPPQHDEAEAGRDSTPTLVKRLVGMPGDTLYMRNGLLYVDGIAQRQGYAAANNPKFGANDTDPHFTWEHTVELKNTRFGSAPAQPTHDDWGPLLIPADHYMMMGDNRYCSKDSRYWGLVPEANVRGRPMFVYYSYVPESDAPRTGVADDPCNGETSDRPLSFITNIRWGRIGHVIH